MTSFTPVFCSYIGASVGRTLCRSAAAAMRTSLPAEGAGAWEKAGLAKEDMLNASATAKIAATAKGLRAMEGCSLVFAHGLRCGRRLR